MRHSARRGYVTSVLWLCATAGATALVGGAAMVTSNEAPAGLLPADGIHQLDPSRTYLGNAGCTGSGCHSGEAKEHSGRQIGNENTLWDEKDPHSKAFKNLSNDKGKKIAAAMKLDDATKADRCLQCHATNVPEARRGPKFAKDLGKEGVSCESCHGAAQDWNDPHQKAGWTDAQRKTPGALAKLGMIDTYDLGIRARMCVSCHLEIDKDMLDAGHPALDFEMYSYNNYKFAQNWLPHWDEHGTIARKAQLWAVGQVAAANAAASGKVEKSLADLFNSGKAIVKDKFGSDDLETLAKTEPGKDKIIAALGALVESAGAYKSGAANKHHREVITSGVDALVNATNAKVPDAYFDAIDAALKAEGDSWVDALKKMQGFAK